MKFDLTQLIASLAAVERQIDNTVLEVSQKITLDVHANVVRGSPVDTGTFRGAWSVDVPEKPYADGQVENNTVYGPRLVHGWSDQAPSGWVSAAVDAATKLGGQ